LKSGKRNCRVKMAKTIQVKGIHLQINLVNAETVRAKAIL